jgi:hypothetical protein
MGTVIEPRTTRDLERAAGWILLGASALRFYGTLLYVTGQETQKIPVIAASLGVTLIGLVASRRPCGSAVSGCSL